MKQSTIAILSVVALTVLLLVFAATIGAVLLFFEIVFGIAYYARKKCANCG